MLGSGDYRFELVDRWPALPKYWSLVSAVGVAVNSSDEIHVLGLGRHPLTIWDPAGAFVSSWGDGAFSTNPHGIHIGPDDHVWVVDRDYHIASEFTASGELVRVLGNRLIPSPTAFGEPFNMPSGLAISPSGDIFVSDGYGNRRVHRFNSAGELLLSWGEPGAGPGEFSLLHNVCVDRLERVYICDRMNHRIQIFDPEGALLDEWRGFKEPVDVCVSDDVLYVAEQGDGSAVSLWTMDREAITRWRGSDGEGTGTLAAAHGIYVDSAGSIYVADVRGDRPIRKFQRI